MIINMSMIVNEYIFVQITLQILHKNCKTKKNAIETEPKEASSEQRKHFTHYLSLGKKFLEFSNSKRQVTLSCIKQLSKEKKAAGFSLIHTDTIDCSEI